RRSRRRPKGPELGRAQLKVAHLARAYPARLEGPVPAAKGPGTRPRSAQSRSSRQGLSRSAGGPGASGGGRSASGGGLSAGAGELGAGRATRKRRAAGSARQHVVRTVYQSHLLGGVRPFPAYVTNKGGPPAHQRAEAVAETGQEAEVDEQ